MSDRQETQENLQLEVLTPGRMVAQLSVPMVTLPGVEGYFGVLPGHMHLITKLKPGVVSYEEGGMPRRMAISTAIVEVAPEKVIVLARSAELGDDIDVERARASMEEAKAKIASLPEGDEGHVEAEAENLRALARVQAVEEEE
ncbi:MAG: ATP synthase F1 subunit epsilon [Nitrospinota bacterium]|nr:ATP synthase F1 subunit epsilon [Nitrospinota bacterium]